MIIVGACGFAQEVLQICHENGELNNVAFFDNLSSNLPKKLFNRYPIISSFEQVKDWFSKYGSSFTLGIGSPLTRKKIHSQFIELGGKFTSTISPNANIGAFNTKIGKGVNLMTGVVVTNSVTIGDGCLINLNATIGHDCTIGEFSEISPGANVSGNCTIGRFCNLGTNSVILPGLRIGDEVNVGAGAVVTKDVPNNSTVVGIPAKSIK